MMNNHECKISNKKMLAELCDELGIATRDCIRDYLFQILGKYVILDFICEIFI